ncbi:MAG: hypothetical protein ACO21B_07725, partial [Gemmobacter sp.]
RLRSGGGNDDLDSLKALGEHVVDGVPAGTPDAEHGDPRPKFLGLARFHQIECHCPVRLPVWGPVAQITGTLHLVVMIAAHAIDVT